MQCEAKDCQAQARTKGLCPTHYSRLWRYGTTERRNTRNGDRCSVPDCPRKPFAKNLCSRHYQQALPPERAIWKLLRSRYAGDYPPAWDDYDQFIADVGTKPEAKYQLRRIDKALPWSAQNCEWRAPVRVNGATGLTVDMAAYQRAWSYLRKFGLREEDIQAMRDEQDDKCPICTEPLERLHPDTEKPIKICVDHDHLTGAVRGLLCDPCNKGLGHFDDNIEALRRAIAYLEHHAQLDAPS